MASKQKGKAVKVKYIDTLDDTARTRYLRKLELIGGNDPYQIKKKWTVDHEGLPGVTYFDIVNYLVYTLSAYSMDNMKAYKSLEAYNQFVCGWVKEVVHQLVNDKVLLFAKVRHSQRMNDPPLSTWIVATKEGTILAGHCKCMAGLGEVCSHVGAVLFWVEAAVKIRNSRTVTEVAAYWLLPTGIRNVDYDMVQDINFQSASTMKKRLDAAICSSPAPRPLTANKLPNVPPLSTDEFSSFLKKLDQSKTKPVILALTPKYASNYIPSSLAKSYPVILSELYDENCAEMAKSDLIKHCETVFENISVSREQANHVERHTRNQAKSKDWFRFRTGRITASRLRSVCHTTCNRPAKSLIQAICYPEMVKFHSKATSWGCEHEADALNTYCEIMKVQHENFLCIESGLVINPELPFMGASPDSIVSCDCCGEGTLEIKCPFCVRSKKLSEAIDSKSCLELIDDKLQLKTTHAYYYQVQAQLFLCKKEYSDFVVWTESDLHVERIEPNVAFWTSNVDKAKHFFKEVILPELVGKIYSRSQPESTNVQPSCSGAAAADQTASQSGLQQPLVLGAANLQPSCSGAATVDQTASHCDSGLHQPVGLGAANLQPSCSGAAAVDKTASHSGLHQPLVLGPANLQPSCSGAAAVDKTASHSGLHQPVVPAATATSGKDQELQASDNEDDLIICICRQRYGNTYKKVIGCDNQNCPYMWLHFSCINMKRTPKGNWYCPECRKLPEFSKRKLKSKLA